MKPGSFLFALGMVLQLATQPAIPNTPAGRQFANWLSAFNREDPALLREFVSKNASGPAGSIDRWIDMRAQTGGFELKKMEESSSTKLSGVLKERDSDRYARFSVEVGPEPPHPVGQLTFRLIPRPAEFPPVARLS